MRVSASVLVLAAFCACAGDVQAASFQSLGFAGYPHGISDNGVVVGHAGEWGQGAQAFIWTSGGGAWSLGNLGGDQYDNAAWDLSADGMTVVGTSGTATGQTAFRWTPSSGMEPLVTTPGLNSNASAISANGAVIVGSVSDSNNRWQPFMWSAASGAQIISEVTRGEAADVSADGTVIVGTHAPDSQWEPFRWSAAGGLERVGKPTDDSANWARKVSADGTVIAGKAEPMDQAFRWSAEDGTQRLGPITGPQYTVWNWQEPYGISADGSTIVGRAFLGDLEDAAFIWTEEHGMRILQKVLYEECGLAVGGWYLPVATAISPDGTMIAGYGYHENVMQAWVAVVPEPVCLGWAGALGVMLLRRRSSICRET